MCIDFAANLVESCDIAIDGGHLFGKGRVLISHFSIHPIVVLFVHEV